MPDLGQRRSCYLSYEVPYFGPEGGRPGRAAQIVIHTCLGNLGIVKILRYIRSDMYTAKINRNFFFGRKMPPPLAKGALCLSTPKYKGKSGTGRVLHLYFLYLD